MKRKTKRKIKRFLFLLFVAVLGSIFYYIDKNSDLSSEKKIEQSIESLGYNLDSTNKIIELKLNEIILKNEYSKTLEESLNNNLFNKDCLNSYFSLKEDKIKDIYYLCNLKYSDKEIEKITSTLDAQTIKQIKKYLGELTKYLEHSNFKIENYERYVIYDEENIQKRISLVNIGLDFSFYENIKDSINQDNDLLLVNKYYKLSEDYIHKNLTNINIEYASNYNVKLQNNAAIAFENLCKDSKALGYTIRGISGYRSYETQKALYNGYLKSDSLKNVDSYSARAGHSEHQTGFAIDVDSGASAYTSFGKTSSYKWAKDNIHNYGFIIRYTEENSYITGYQSEPWHFRYVGKDVATYIFNNNLSLEEYLLNDKIKI